MTQPVQTETTQTTKVPIDLELKQEIEALKDEINTLKQISHIRYFNTRIKDVQFDDLSFLLKDWKQGEVYIVTNNPITVSDNSYIQNGTTHTVIGMQYGDNMGYGFQLSMSGAGMKFRHKWGGNWNPWETK